MSFTDNWFQKTQGSLTRKKKTQKNNFETRIFRQSCFFLSSPGLATCLFTCLSAEERHVGGSAPPPPNFSLVFFLSFAVFFRFFCCFLLVAWFCCFSCLGFFRMILLFFLVLSPMLADFSLADFSLGRILAKSSFFLVASPAFFQGKCACIFGCFFQVFWLFFQSNPAFLAVFFLFMWPFSRPNFLANFFLVFFLVGF